MSLRKKGPTASSEPPPVSSEPPETQPPASEQPPVLSEPPETQPSAAPSDEEPPETQPAFGDILRQFGVDVSETGIVDVQDSQHD